MAAPVENSLMFAEALARAGVPLPDLHIYERYVSTAHDLGFAPYAGITSPANMKSVDRWIASSGLSSTASPSKSTATNMP